MSVVLPLTLAIILAPAPKPKPEPPSEDTTKSDTKKIQGIWELTSATDGAGKRPAKDVTGARMEVKDNNLTIKEKSRDEKATFKLDAAKKKLKHIDITPANQKTAVQGLYKFDKDTLVICFIMSGSGKGRPTGFNDPNARTLVFKRLAPAKK